jgi:hypothetical protein
MASNSIPDYRGSRVNVHSFVRDLLDGGRVDVDHSTIAGWSLLRLEDGHGMSFVLSGDRDHLRLLVSGVLAQLTPDPEPEPGAGGGSEELDSGGEAA